MATVLTIGGTAVSFAQYNLRPVLTLRFDGRSSLTLQCRGGKLPTKPDPWLGKEVVLSIDGTTYFKGDVVRCVPQWTNLGWCPAYTCTDLKARCDRIPFTDENTKTDAAGFNLSPLDPNSIASRQGRSVGQILTDCLKMVTNATALNAKGVGAYTTLTPVTLPSSTVSDLASLTVVPPAGVYIQGERLIAAIEGFLRFWAPNYLLWIEPATGALRFLDKRGFSGVTLTLGTDPISPSPLSRDVCDCFQRVVIRGQPIAEAKLLGLSNGGLAEDFAWGPYTTNAAAKAAWTPDQTITDQLAKSEGTCSCTDTLNVVVNPTDNSQSWVANYWDQTSTGYQGTIQVEDTGLAGVTMFVTRRIVANAALSAGGTANVQLDLPLPATSYNHYKLYGMSSGASLVWKKYLVTDSDIAGALANQFTYPQPFVGANGNYAEMTSFPMGSVVWSASGSPPYEERTVGITVDPASGHVYFLQATYVANGNRVPTDVRALVAVNTGNLTAIWPANTGTPAVTPAYGGTSYTVEGMQETLTLTVGQWRDPINLSAMLDFAKDVHDSVKDAVIEGEVIYHGKYLTALTPGVALSIAGNGYTTGWEGLALPILEAEVRWNSGVETQFTVSMRVSNRRQSLSPGAFMKPDRQVGGQVVNPVGLTPALAASMAGRLSDTLSAAASPGGTLGAFSGAAGLVGVGGDQSAGAYLPEWATGTPPQGQRAKDAEYNRLIRQLEGDPSADATRAHNEAVAGLESGGGWETAAQKRRGRQHGRAVDRSLEQEMQASVVYATPQPFADVPPVPESERGLPPDVFGE